MKEPVLIADKSLLKYDIFMM